MEEELHVALALALALALAGLWTSHKETPK